MSGSRFGERERDVRDVELVNSRSEPKNRIRLHKAASLPVSLSAIAIFEVERANVATFQNSISSNTPNREPKLNEVVVLSPTKCRASEIAFEIDSER